MGFIKMTQMNFRKALLESLQAQAQSLVEEKSDNDIRTKLSKLNYNKMVQLYDETVDNNSFKLFFTTDIQSINDVFKGYNASEIFDILVRSNLSKNMKIFVAVPGSSEIRQIIGFASREQFVKWFVYMLTGNRDASITEYERFHEYFEDVFEDMVALIRDDEDARRYYSF